MESYYVVRLLTDEELEYIVSGFDYKIVVSNYVNEYNGKSLKESVKQLFRNKQFKIGNNTTKFLRTRIAQQLIKARTHPGDAVGMLAGSALSQSMQQATLNTFHRAGSMNLNGIDALNEIVKNHQPKYPECTVHFKNIFYTIKDVYDLQYRFVGITAQSILKNYTYINEEESNKSEWKEMYLDITGKILPQSNTILRLFFNTNDLYKYKLNLSDIVKSIESDSPPSVVCICSPTYQGIVDVYVDTDQAFSTLNLKVKNHNFNRDNAGQSFLAAVILPTLSDILVDGISGIKKITPIEKSVWSIVQNFEPLYPTVILENQNDEQMKDKMRRSWTIYFSPSKMIRNGIPKAKLLKLFEVLAIKSLKPLGRVFDSNIIYIMLPNGVYDDPAKFINKKLDFDKKVRRIFDIIPLIEMISIIETTKENQDRIEEYILTFVSNKNKNAMKSVLKNLDIQLTSRETELSLGVQSKESILNLLRTYIQSTSSINLSSLGNYVYAKTEGSNLKQLLTHNLVQPYYTYSNNMREIYDVLGIEAVRLYIILRLQEIYELTDSDIAVNHMALVADLMTSTGEITGLEIRGQTKREKGALARASVEQQQAIMMGAAAFGSEESTNTTTTSIFTANRPNVGTGAFDVIIDKTKEDEYKRQINMNVKDNVFSFSDIAANLPNLSIPEDNLDISNTVVSSLVLDSISMQ